MVDNATLAAIINRPHERSDSTPKSVIIATPIGGKPETAYMMAMLAAINLLRERGVVYRYISVNGCSDLAYARNALAAQFLMSGFTDLVWVDDDMGFPPDAIVKLLGNDADFVGAVYRQRLRSGELAAREAPDGTVEATGLGLTKTSRRVFEAIQRAHPELRRPEDHPNVARDGISELWRFFSFSGDGDGEDMRFCEMWRSTGGVIHLDESIRTSHIGSFDYDWRPDRDR